MIAVRHLERIREELGRAGADALQVHPSVGFAYLTGLARWRWSAPTALLICPRRPARPRRR